ncbi:MAG: SA1002 family membrane protein [Tractidigestivibacter sp.]|jgi:hypothetical protein|uniref:SA1002 family membrane protein n=1 Tax=Tractidigestivibacter sp. TaxID=2847320 RepID=UPI003D920B17
MSSLIGFLIRIALVLVPLYVAGRIMFKGEGVARRLKIMRVVGSFVGILAVNALIMLALLALTVAAEYLITSTFPDHEIFLFTVDGHLSGANLLVYIFLLIFVTAFIHYWLRGRLKRVWPRLDLDDDECTIFEYFIQWVTIYLVVYQCFFEGFQTLFEWFEESGETSLQGIFQIALSPSNINLVIQPLLIAAWVLVVLERFARENARNANAK